MIERGWYEGGFIRKGSSLIYKWEDVVCSENLGSIMQYVALLLNICGMLPYLENGVIT
jgi:hypothetical protein